MSLAWQGASRRPPRGMMGSGRTRQDVTAGVRSRLWAGPAAAGVSVDAGNVEGLAPDADSREMRALIAALAASRQAMEARLPLTVLDDLAPTSGLEPEEEPAVRRPDASLDFASDEEPIRPFQPIARREPPPDLTVRRLGVFAALAIPFLAATAYGASHLGPVDRPVETENRGDLGIAPSAGSPLPAAKPMVPVLLKAEVDFAQSFSQLSTRPATLCQALDFAGLGATTWQRSPWDAATFECSSPLEANEDGEAPGWGDRFFFIVRGAGQDRVTSLRVKVRMAGFDGAANARLRQFLSVLSDFKDLAIPSLVAQAAIEGRPAVMKTLAGSYRFEAEKGDASNFNLIVNYGPSSTGVMPTAPEALNRVRSSLAG